MPIVLACGEHVHRSGFGIVTKHCRSNVQQQGFPIPARAKHEDERMLGRVAGEAVAQPSLEEANLPLVTAGCLTKKTQPQGAVWRCRRRDTRDLGNSLFGSRLAQL